jgi:taurine dioxygenase
MSRGLPEIRPLDAALGAEVIGVELSRTLDDASHAVIRAALQRHRVLLFRGEPRPNEALVAFARRLGPLVTLYEHETTVPGHPDIVRVSNVEEDGRPIGLAGEQEIPWHHDHPYLERPAKESFLEAVELPREPPTTSFVDMVAALDALPESLRLRLRGLRAAHHIDERAGDDEKETNVLGPSGVTPEYSDETNVLAQERIAAQRAVHPLVVRHPDSGLAALYASPLATHEIVGMPDAEAATLLGELFDRAIRAERIYSHEWSLGDFVVWDTIATLHRREAFAAAGRRLMKQMSTQCACRLEAAD